VFGGIAAAAALQEIYEQAFDLPHRRIKDLPHRLAWLAVLIGASLLSGWAGPGLRHAGGPALLAVAGLVWATGFWWLTMRILLAGRISWRALFPAACATGVLYVAMQTVFSLVFSAMVISDEHTYGPIGTIFALLSYLIAVGVVVILGAVAGRAWHERSPGTSETGQLPSVRPFSVATACACPGGDGRHMPFLNPGQVGRCSPGGGSARPVTHADDAVGQVGGVFVGEAFRPWPASPSTSSQADPVTLTAATTTKNPATLLSMAMTWPRPSATLNPM
jgi:Virulence factor BrkB